MMRAFSTLLIAATLSISTAWADPVVLRDRVEASGPAVTLGDVFTNTGAASGRAISPAPPPGQVSTISMAVLSAAASAAGLDWTAPAGVTNIRVTRPGGARATVPPQNGMTPISSGGSTQSVAGAAIHRGEMVTLIYNVPGMQLTAHARAVEDGAVGQAIRLVNLTSNRTIDATVTGPGAADANSTP